MSKLETMFQIADLGVVERWQGQSALYIHKGRRPRPNPVEQAENSTHWPVINNRASHRPTSPTRRPGRVSFKETIAKSGQSGKMASIDHPSLE